MAEKLGIPLVDLQVLRRVYEENKGTPFPDTYVETGLALIPGEEGYSMNKDLAEILAADFGKKGIEIREGRVPNFSQLRLIPNQETGLAFKLNETAEKDKILNLRDYKWDYVGKNGLFRAYLNVNGYWNADDDNLADSGNDGRVVCYDAEGVEPKKPTSDVPIDEITKRINNFRKRLE
jgi:hypothetical protein